LFPASYQERTAPALLLNGINHTGAKFISRAFCSKSVSFARIFPRFFG
jgi:hypothetical protein